LRNQLPIVVSMALLAFSILGVAIGDSTSGGADSNSTTTTVTPPPASPQTTNATLEYDLTNRLTENGVTCTYEWGPMFTLYRTPDEFGFNFSSTSPIDVYVFDPDDYSGTVSCTFGPRFHAPYTPIKLTGKQGQLTSACLGCEKEGGRGSSFYVLFINQDTAVVPHVTLQVAVKLYATTTTTTTESWCTVIAESYLMIHLADESGKPIPNARVVLNGTFSCQPPPSEPRLNPWGITDSNGDVGFGVLPTAKYNVTVILPENLQSRTIIVTQITAPRPTFSAKVDIACTPSANRCTIAAPRSETPTTSITGGLLAVPFLNFPATFIAIILGFFLIAKLRRRRD